MSLRASNDAFDLTGVGRVNAVTVLIDPPIWQGHGTKWSHLVSDHSLGELHEFAENNRVPRRAFDLDHYDVPIGRYRELVECGANPVTGKELIVRLRLSGLRVHGSRRNRRLKESMFLSWQGQFPDTFDIGWELVGRWNEPHRHYHGLSHLRHALNALGRIAEPEESTKLAALALWFHDAIHEGEAGADEEASARLAVDLLSSYTTGERAWITPEEVEEVSRLVMVTAGHRPEPGDRQGELVSDADLAILGSDAIAYRRYTDAIRLEYSHFNDAEFNSGRANVLVSLSEQLPLFRTEQGRELWQATAERNIAAERQQILLAH